jgi:hypothetical protein
MSHTALSISTSPNPKILEMRILAHHATDERFAFLRGRWKDVWERVKVEVKKEKAQKSPTAGGGLGGLVGGYESDSGEESEEGEGDVPPEPAAVPPPPPIEEDLDHVSGPPLLSFGVGSPAEAEDEEVKRRIRRQKAEEWKRRRAEEKIT